jgi:hypothetical protein
MPLTFASTPEQPLTTEHKVQGITFAPVTLAGRPATIEEGSLSVTVQSGNGSVGPSAGDTIPDLLTGDDADTTVFLVTADADLGEGVSEISDTITVIAEGALAANLGLGGGSIVAK